MVDGSLQGKAALVTGGGTGIGLGCARRLASDGALVTICGRREDVLAAAVQTIGHDARYVVCDIQIEEQVANAAAVAAAPLGGLHIAVVNAGGGFTAGPIVLGDVAGWRTQMDINVIGSFLTIKHTAPLIAHSGGGSIVAISSIAASHTHRQIAAYSVSKAAVDMLVRNAADELGEFGVRVNAIRPGLVPTDASDPLNSDATTHDDYIAQMPLGRTGTVDEIAAAVRFLAGDEAAWITGQSFGVDGGHSLRRGPNLDPLIGTMFRAPLDELMRPPGDEPMSDDDLFRVTLDRAGRGPAGHPTRDDISVLSPDFYVEPDERFAWMRANAPVYWDDATGIWALASHEAVRIAAKEWQTFCSGQGSRPDSSVPSMINMDAPEHSFRRGIVKAGFTVQRVKDHEPYLRQKIGELIDAVADRGQCDIVRDIATPLPMYMIGTMMGLPESDHAQLLHWSDLFAAGDADLLEQIVQAVGEWNEYILAHAATVRGRGNTDLISLMCDAERDGKRLNDVDLMFESMLVLVGGDETTRHVISAGVDALLRHPDQLALLRDDPSLIPTAVEEMLRWATPVKNMNRTATRDVDLCGQQIHEGDRLLLLYPSANRDEAVFDDPQRFDVRRDPNPHVAFGAYGRHHCLGAPLARLELRVLFEELLARFDTIQLVDPDATPPQRRGNFVVGIEELPVRLTPRR